MHVTSSGLFVVSLIVGKSRNEGCLVSSVREYEALPYVHCRTEFITKLVFPL